MDPAICDSCLHLSAVPSRPGNDSPGVPVACEAIMAPPASSSVFAKGCASAVPGVMHWQGQPGHQRLIVTGLGSKQLGVVRSAEPRTGSQVWSLFMSWVPQCQCMSKVPLFSAWERY